MVTSQQFLDAVFKHRWPGEHIILGQKWVGSDGRIGFKSARMDDYPKAVNDHFDHVSISTQKKTKLGTGYGGQMSRKELAIALHALVIDDVFEKVPAPDLPPSIVIETKPGSQQWWYLFKSPIRDQRMAQSLVHSLCASGVTDPGMSGVTRWARLPTTLIPPGKNFNARCTLFRPSRRYPPGDDLLWALGAHPVRMRAGNPDTGARSDAVTKWMQREGYRCDGPNHDGWFVVDCPRGDEHSSGDGEAGYHPGFGAFSCFHGHTAGTGGKPDLAEFMRTIIENGGPQMADFEVLDDE